MDVLGPLSDVCSLGATLYCLLAGRPAFEGDLVTVLRKVQAGEFPSPRKVDPSLDPALEAVCCRAMANLPQDRYPSARALAEEVERRLADEPVEAYHEPFRRRLSRWERRHKTLVNGGMAGLMITTIVSGLSSAMISREKQATEKARAEAEQAALRADSNFTRAVQAVFEPLSRTADQKFNRVPGMEGVRRELSDSAVYQMRRFLQVKPDDIQLLQMADRVHRDAGLVRWLIGDAQEAVDLYTSGERNTREAREGPQRRPERRRLPIRRGQPHQARHGQPRPRQS